MILNALNRRYGLYWGFILILGFTACNGGSKKLPPVTGLDAEMRRCLQLSENKKYEEAAQCLEVFKSRYPGGPEASGADLLIADNYFNKKEYLVAAETYQQFIKANPYHEKQDYAYYKTGMAYLKDSPKALDRDQQYLDVAAQNFSMVARYFPQSRYYQDSVTHFNQTMARLAAREYYVARYYYKYGEYLASLPRFEKIIRQYPGVGYDEKSFYYLIMASLKTDQRELARQAYLAFEQKYPSSSLVKSARSKMLSSQ